MRIILSPLINTIPLVGAITYFFLKKPVSVKRKIEFNFIKILLIFRVLILN
jgi:hypothetical protein